MMGRQSSRSNAGRCAQRGVTLIELMVGLVIGLIATIVVAQVLWVAEGQKRNTTGGTDALLNGSLSLYTLQRNISMAGYGLNANKAWLGCTINGNYSGTAASWTLAPVTITAGADAKTPDQITVLTGTSNAAVPSTTLTAAQPQTSTSFVVSSTVGVGVGDLMVAIPAAITASNWCTAFNVTAVDSATRTISHTAAGATAPWNPASLTTLFPAAGYAANDSLVDAGQLTQRRYSINMAARTLQEAVSTTQTGGTFSAATELFPGIVHMRALYGKDTDGNGVVDVYDQVTPTNASEWQQVLAVRLAVVARSNQYDKDEVTAASPQWDLGTQVPVTGSSVCGSSKCLALDLSDLPDWKHYRYKVYESIIPLRNMLW